MVTLRIRIICNNRILIDKATEIFMINSSREIDIDDLESRSYLTLGAFIAGGWFCFDRLSCHLRWINLKHLMSSRNWPPTKKGIAFMHV